MKVYQQCRVLDDIRQQECTQIKCLYSMKGTCQGFFVLIKWLSVKLLSILKSFHFDGKLPISSIAKLYLSVSGDKVFIELRALRTVADTLLLHCFHDMQNDKDRNLKKIEILLIPVCHKQEKKLSIYVNPSRINSKIVNSDIEISLLRKVHPKSINVIQYHLHFPSILYILNQNVYTQSIRYETFPRVVLYFVDIWSFVLCQLLSVVFQMLSQNISAKKESYELFETKKWRSEGDSHKHFKSSQALSVAFLTPYDLVSIKSKN